MENPNNGRMDWLKAFLTVIAVLILYRAIQLSGWFGGIGAYGDRISLGISFLIGIAASFSSCLVVAGGIVVAFSEKYKSSEKNSVWSGALQPNLKFHVGRILTFFVLGGLLGLFGGKLNLGGNFISAYTTLIAVVMAWLGLNILGFVPPISSLGIRMPKFLVRYWGKLEESEHKTAPYFLGGITFFLPCGFTQSMQIFALASGSFLAGAFAMSAFALGTMPVLLALGAATSLAKLEKMAFVSKAAGIMVILFAVYTFSSGFAIWSVKNDVPEKIPVPNQKMSKGVNDSSSFGAAQNIEMKITSRGFEPSVLRVKNNIPVRFSINGDEATGCTSKIVIPGFGIAEDIKKGDNVIEFTPTKAGPIPFSCWMGMVRGKFIVE
ncbi:MAG: sulfite exporter TauE/SafE family protein [Parcubacteria group bacterium]|jgi:sulfite exporter TauE/SafE